MEEVIIDGRKYISAKQAAEITKYSQDYIGQLVRAGTLPGRLIGRTRFVEEEVLLRYSRDTRPKSHDNAFQKESVTTLPTGEQKTEESTQPEESKISDHVFSEPTGYSHGWQSRSRFDQVTEIGIKIENAQENFLKKLFSRIKNNLPRNTAFISMLLVVSGVFVLFSSNEINNRLAYISTAKTETPVNQKTNQIAAVADIGILDDLTSNIKKTIDNLALRTYKNISGSGNRLISFVNGLFTRPASAEAGVADDLTSNIKKIVNNLALRTYKNISGSGNRLISFVSNLFSGAGQNFFALFNKNENKDVAPETVAVDSYAPKSAPVKITRSNQTETTKGEAPKVPATEPPRIIERIIERVVERVPATVVTADVDSKLEQLKNKVFSEIYKVADGLSTKTNTVYQAVSLTNKIDTLNQVSISNATISGSTYAGSVAGTSGSFSGSLSANGGLSATTGTFSGNLTVEGVPTFYGALTLPYFTATSTTATSTISGKLLTTFVPSVAHSFGSWSSGVSGSNPLTASVIINPSSATADSNLLALAVNNSAKFLIDAEGDVFANSLTASGGVTLSTTTASTFSVENNSTFGDSTTTDRTYFNSRIGSSLIPTVTNALDLGDTVNGLAWRTGIFGTSIGVGTTSPYAALSVVGETVSTYFTATSTTATSTFAGGLSAAGSQFTVLQNGLVGIGTTSPYAKLSVVGPVIAEYFHATSTTATSTFAGGLSAAGSSGFTIFQNGNIVIGTTTPYSKFSIWGAGASTGQLFELTNSASTTIARFLDNGAGYLLGNLGIGTTSPYAPLSVVGETVSAYFTATSTTATSTFGGGVKLSKAGTGIEFSDGTIQTIAPRTPSMQVFTSSGTWTKPSGVTKIKITVVGGGGGGGSYSGGIYGSGGGGGGTCIEYINVSAVSSETITIGAAGSASSGGAGGNGGTSSFGAYCSATGGTGGTAGGPSSGGGGGVGSGGDLNIRGGAGESSYGTNPGHPGGASIFGGGDNTNNPTYGGGGSTAYPEGRAGAAGVVVVEEY